MASTHQDPMEDVERRRQQLEDNVSNLRQALTQWQTWELEYEMLKEEIQAVGSPSSSKMLDIGKDLKGRLVTEKEVIELLGKDGQPKRTANQVIDMISRRVDYVQQNQSTVQKQLETAERKLAGATVLLEPDMENEEGLPLMEIEEELDDEGNVISSAVVQPGKSAPDIVEALRKAGVQKAEQAKKHDGKDAKSTSSSKKPETTSRNTAQPAPTQADAPKPPPKPSPKKSVSFSEDTKPDPSAESLASLQETGYNEDITDYNWTKGTKVIELDDEDNEIASYPIIPQGESPEEAALRRQMLQYGLSEVGQVVAEIDLDNPSQEYSDEDENYDFDEEYESDEEEDEDQYGRSTRREVTDDYHQKMLDLEKKLNARMMENVGPAPDADTLAEYSGDIRTLKIRKDEDFDKSVDKPASPSEPPETKKKGVRFADALDISPSPDAGADRSSSALAKSTTTNTISDTIVERSAPQPRPSSEIPSKPAKISRFKSSRTTSNQPGDRILPSPAIPEPQPVPSGPTGRTLANTIVEHEVQPSANSAPDEFDPSIIDHEVQVQYNKMRNKFIQRQGGFTPTKEEQDDPLVEEKDGKTQKVSRFRAARLKADGL